MVETGYWSGNIFLVEHYTPQGNYRKSCRAPAAYYWTEFDEPVACIAAVALL